MAPAPIINILHFLIFYNKLLQITLAKPIILPFPIYNFCIVLGHSYNYLGKSGSTYSQSIENQECTGLYLFVIAFTISWETNPPSTALRGGKLPEHVMANFNAYFFYDS